MPQRNTLLLIVGHNVFVFVFVSDNVIIGDLCFVLLVLLLAHMYTSIVKHLCLNSL